MSLRVHVHAVICRYVYTCTLLYVATCTRARCHMSLRVAYIDQTEYIENQGAVLGISGHGYVFNTPIGSDLEAQRAPKDALDAVLVGHAPLCCARWTRAFDCSNRGFLGILPFRELLSAMFV